MHKSSTALVSDCIVRIIRTATTPGLFHKSKPFIKTIRAHPEYWLTEEEDKYIFRLEQMHKVIDSRPK